MFTLCLAESLLADPADESCVDAIGAAWLVVVKPLPPGEYTIVGSVTASETVKEEGFPTGEVVTMTTTYHVTVVPRGRC